MIGLENPIFIFLALFAIPIGYLWLKTSGYGKVIVSGHLSMIILLVLALSQPHFVFDVQEDEEKVVSLVADETPSTQILDRDEINTSGMEVKRTRLTGSEETITDTLVENTEDNSEYVLDTDLQTIETQRLINYARENNITFHMLEQESDPATSVSIDAPEIGVQNTDIEVLVSVSSTKDDIDEPNLHLGSDGVDLEKIEEGEWVAELKLDETGYHGIRATVPDSGDLNNTDEYYHSIKIIEPPQVFILGGPGEITDQLEENYEVEYGEALSDDLDEYSAVYLKENPSADEVDRLEQFVLEGGGLLHSADLEPEIEHILPIQEAEDPQETSAAQIIFAVDRTYFSGDCPSHPCGPPQSDFDVEATGETNTEAMRVAYSLVNELPGHNRVGGIGFDRDNVVELAETKVLDENRGELMESLERMEVGGLTGYVTGIEAAHSLIDEENDEANIIMVSDGVMTLGARNANEEERAYNLAEELNASIITVGVGENPNREFLENLASKTGGHYVDATQGESLEFMFEAGGAEEGEVPLGVSQPNHYITQGISMVSTAQGFRNVETESGADKLVAGSNGVPAISSWRYGLGRVISLSLYDQGQKQLATYDPDVVSRSFAWTVGDLAEGSGTTTWTEDGNPRIPPKIVSNERKDGFIQEGPQNYVKTLETDTQGLHEHEDHVYAYNYHPDLKEIGKEGNWRESISRTGGETINLDRGSIEQVASTRAIKTKETFELGPYLILAALIIFLIQLGYRKRSGRL